MRVCVLLSKVNKPITSVAYADLPRLRTPVLMSAAFNLTPHDVLWKPDEKDEKAVYV